LNRNFDLKIKPAGEIQRVFLWLLGLPLSVSRLRASRRFVAR
jgi:hypothetical protein